VKINIIIFFNFIIIEIKAIFKFNWLKNLQMKFLWLLNYMLQQSWKWAGFLPPAPAHARAQSVVGTREVPAGTRMQKSGNCYMQ